VIGANWEACGGASCSRVGFTFTPMLASKTSVAMRRESRSRRRRTRPGMFSGSDATRVLTRLSYKVCTENSDESFGTRRDRKKLSGMRDLVSYASLTRVESSSVSIPVSRLDNLSNSKDGARTSSLVG